MFIDLLKFTTKFVRSNFLVFFFVPLVVQKVKKVKSVNIQSDCETLREKRTDSSCVFTRSRKVWNTTKQQVKNEQIKRKLFDKKKQFVLSVHFVKCY